MTAYRTPDLAAECAALRAEVAALRAKLHPPTRLVVRPGGWGCVVGCVVAVVGTAHGSDLPWRWRAVVAVMQCAASLLLWRGLCVRRVPAEGSAR